MWYQQDLKQEVMWCHSSHFPLQSYIWLVFLFYKEMVYDKTSSRWYMRFLVIFLDSYPSRWVLQWNKCLGRWSDQEDYGMVSTVTRNSLPTKIPSSPPSTNLLYKMSAIPFTFLLTGFRRSHFNRYYWIFSSLAFLWTTINFLCLNVSMEVRGESFCQCRVKWTNHRASI